jgi:hypothetical protein
MEATFAPGTVGHTLGAMVGTWHDRVEVFALDGTPLPADTRSGSPGPAPWENLVYIDFDGEQYRQTNVTVKGRPLQVRTFTGRLVEGVLFFDRLGPEDPQHVGVSGGPGIVCFVARRITNAWARYAEPDVIRLLGPNERSRTTILYRDGGLVRTLTAFGVRVSPTAHRRLDWDPRGAGGEVHAMSSESEVFVR